MASIFASNAFCPQSNAKIFVVNTLSMYYAAYTLELPSGSLHLRHQLHASKLHCAVMPSHNFLVIFLPVTDITRAWYEYVDGPGKLDLSGLSLSELKGAQSCIEWLYTHLILPAYPCSLLFLSTPLNMGALSPSLLGSGSCCYMHL